MNEPWIKMRKKIVNDPRVVVAAIKAGVSENEMLGGLLRLWFMADDHGSFLSAFDADMLDTFVRIKGFTDALPDDWLMLNDAGITLPNYDEHNGTTAKRRASETKRKAGARKTSASSADKMRTRVVKSRVDKSIKDKNKTTLDFTIPDGLKCFKTEIEQWWKYKKEIKKPLKTQMSVTKAYKAMAGYGLDLPAIIDKAISNGHIGLYAMNGKPNKNKPWPVSDEYKDDDPEPWKGTGSRFSEDVK